MGVVVNDTSDNLDTLEPVLELLALVDEAGFQEAIDRCDALPSVAGDEGDQLVTLVSAWISRSLPDGDALDHIVDSATYVGRYVLYRTDEGPDKYSLARWKPPTSSPLESCTHCGRDTRRLLQPCRKCRRELVQAADALLELQDAQPIAPERSATSASAKPAPIEPAAGAKVFSSNGHQLRVSQLATRYLTTNSLYAVYAVKCTVEVNTPRSVRVHVQVQALDADGFELDMVDVCGTVDAGKPMVLTERIHVSVELAPSVHGWAIKGCTAWE